MNVVLNIKEPQLRGVLEGLEKIGNGVDVAINIKENGSKKDGFKEEVFKTEKFRQGLTTEEKENSIREELEEMQKEMKEKVLGNIDA